MIKNNMKLKVFYDIDQIDKSAWSNFVNNHPYGNIFQTPEMYIVYSKTKNHEPILCVVTNEKNKILGILLSVVQKEYEGFIGKFSSRAVTRGGPLIENNDPYILRYILKEYDYVVKRKAIYSQIRNLWNWKELNNVFIDRGFIFNDHLNIIIDLSESEEQLWKDVHSKRRNEIRKALKEDVVFEVANASDTLEICYKILIGVYSRARLPLPGFEHFQSLLENTKEGKGLCIFVAKYGGNIIGCMLALQYKERMYDYYAGAIKEYYHKYPNDLIPWEVIKYSKKKVLRYLILVVLVNQVFLMVFVIIRKNLVAAL